MKLHLVAHGSYCRSVVTSLEGIYVNQLTPIHPASPNLRSRFHGDDRVGGRPSMSLQDASGLQGFSTGILGEIGPKVSYPSAHRESDGWVSDFPCYIEMYPQ